MICTDRLLTLDWPDDESRQFPQNEENVSVDQRSMQTKPMSWAWSIWKKTQRNLIKPEHLVVFRLQKCSRIQKTQEAVKTSAILCRIYLSCAFQIFSSPDYLHIYNVVNKNRVKHLFNSRMMNVAWMHLTAMDEEIWRENEYHLKENHFEFPSAQKLSGLNLDLLPKGFKSQLVIRCVGSWWYLYG